MRRAIPPLAAAAALLGAALLGAGCPDETPHEIEIYSLTSPPPARKAVVVTMDADHHVELSRGVALGIGCWDNCKGTCLAPSFSVADPEVAAVRPVFRAAGGYATWVLLGKAAGRTELTVSTACATQVYAVAVADDQQ